MSFTNRFDSDEFPPLNMAVQMARSQAAPHDSSSSGGVVTKHEQLFSNFLKLTLNERRAKLDKVQYVESPKDFVRCRTGFRLQDYHRDLETLLNNLQVGDCGDFLNVFIEPIRSGLHENEVELLPDLILPHETWANKICIEIKFSPVENPTPMALRKFEQIFLHALYLPAFVIVIASPNSEQSHASIAAIVNQSILKAHRDVLVLFKVHTLADEIEGQSDLELASELTDSASNNPHDHYNDEHDYEGDLTPLDKSPTKVPPPKFTKNPCKTCNEPSTSTSSDTRWTALSDLADRRPVQFKDPVLTSWQQWCSISSHLSDDTRFGVCLTIEQDLPDNMEELNRWKGAPVRMVTVNANRFVRRSSNAPITMEFHCRQFIKSLVRANSLRTCIVLDGCSKENAREYLVYLDYLNYKMRTKKQDPLVSWNDRLQPPLQPLSSNLDSSTYGVFEMDSTKYIKYREAMVAALIKKTVDFRVQKSTRKTIVLMVLGAGRGPLVDCFIDAIKEVKSGHRYKIYALDKNASSVISLMYKLHNHWQDKTGLFEVEVVESDMRLWTPKEKADIIATELLGSFSDNELSPECIDGTWRFSTPDTISIPQEYSSYVAPIYSCKFRQELHRHKPFQADVYDQIYVDRLANFYLISEPQELFNFQHKDISKVPIDGQNERYKQLTFVSKVNVTCHGFIGYFRAHLYGDVEISTLAGHETPQMNSWFPAAIPLECPIDLPLGTRLDICFWRKESVNNVWYQWAVTHPQRTRPHSGEKMAMSKFI